MPVLSNLDNLIVVLVRPRNPLNIGAVGRAMSNFGVQQLRVVNPYQVAFHDARSAVGAAELMKNAQEFADLPDAVRDCTLVVGTTGVGQRALQHTLRRLDTEGGSLIRQHLPSGRVALLFGSEKTGLSNEDFSLCHWLLNIPTRDEHYSMNLGQAVAVCLYELSRIPLIHPASEARELASSEQIEQICDCLFESLEISGYVKPGTSAMFKRKTRKLIRGFELEAYDAKLLLGMVRQIVWKLKQPDKR